MRNAFVTAFAVAAASAVTAASAHDYSNDLICAIRDVGNQKLLYTFANNTQNADGSTGGTYVETGFVRNGRDTVARPGDRPIWIWGERGAALIIHSREAPAYRITLDVGRSAVSGGVVSGPAILWRGNQEIGWGDCARRDQRPSGVTAGQVGDVAGE